MYLLQKKLPNPDGDRLNTYSAKKDAIPVNKEFIFVRLNNI